MFQPQCHGPLMPCLLPLSYLATKVYTEKQKFPITSKSVPSLYGAFSRRAAAESSESAKRHRDEAR
jgi:hypothetical protein